MTFSEMQSKLDITGGRLKGCLFNLQISPTYVLPIINGEATKDYSLDQFNKVKKYNEQIRKRCDK